jgi:site-specific DNA-methyltransferase (adenine-specific)/modification methylase
MKMEVLTPWVVNATAHCAPTCTIYCGDCKEVIKLLDFDAVVTDPPYGIGFDQSKKEQKYHNLKTIIGDDKRFDCTHLLDLVGEIRLPDKLYEKVTTKLNEKKALVIFGANHFCKDIPERGSWLTWDKSCGQGPNTNFTDAEYIWVNRNIKRCIYRHFWLGAFRSGQDNSNNAKRSHPSMKPVELMSWLIESARIGVGKIVLDPYMGVGSTGVACLQSGRSFIGIEIDPEYYEIAKTRLLKQIEIMKDPQPQDFDFSE